MSILKKPHLYQGVYYLITGIWPLLHIESFIVISGPKVDQWLVKMVGILTVIIALTLLISLNRRSRISTPVIFLALASCIGYISIDVYYAFIDRIWDIYLLDALLQVILIIFWIWYLRRRHAL